MKKLFILAVTGCARAARGGVRTRESQPALSAWPRPQLFTLAVPTEKEDATTTQIEFSPPSGLQHRLVRPVTRLEAQGAADRRRRGRRDHEGDVDAAARCRRVKTRRSRSSRSRRSRRPTRSAFARPTPTARSSTGPAPSRPTTLRRRSRFGPRSVEAAAPPSRSIALIVGAVGVLLGALALFSGGSRTIA